MVDSSVPKKLRLNPDHKVLILNAPEGYVENLATAVAMDGIDQVAEGEYDFVQLFAQDSTQLDELIQVALKVILFDGLLWISYPKGSSGVKTDLNRDIIWEKLKSHGIRPVTQISINKVWSAMRFRPIDQVGKK